MIHSPYELVLEEVQRGRLSPFDVDIDYLIEVFRRQAEKLKEGEYLREAGKFLEASAKLLRFKTEVLFPTPEKKRVTIREVREVLEENVIEEDLSLDWLYSYVPKVGRPSGAKVQKPGTLSRKEFWRETKKGVLLHREIDYSELAREVRERILKGQFRIESITDFIAYLFAYYEFEDVPELQLYYAERGVFYTIAPVELLSEQNS